MRLADLDLETNLDLLDWGDSENRHSLILDFFSHIAQGNAQDNYL